MGLFHAGDDVPGNLPRSIALTLELRQEVHFVRHRYACAAAVLVVGAAIHRHVSTAGHVYRLVDETNSPKRVASKADLEALSVGIDPNCRWPSALHGYDFRSVIRGGPDGIMGI